MKLRINITKDNLLRSSNCSTENIGQNCAIGLAIFDLFGESSWVADDHIAIMRGGKPFAKQLIESSYHLIRLSIEVRIFISSFDKATPEKRINMCPLSFDIELPEELVKSITLPNIESVINRTPSLDFVV